MLSCLSHVCLVICTLDLCSRWSLKKADSKHLAGLLWVTWKPAHALRRLKEKKMKCINVGKKRCFLYLETVGINNLIMCSVKNIKHLCFWHFPYCILLEFFTGVSLLPSYFSLLLRYLTALPMLRWHLFAVFGDIEHYGVMKKWLLNQNCWESVSQAINCDFYTPWHSVFSLCLLQSFGILILETRIQWPRQHRKKRNLEKHIKLESFPAKKKTTKTIRETYCKQHMKISSKQLTLSQVIKTHFSRGTNILFPVL